MFGTEKDIEAQTMNRIMALKDRDDPLMKKVELIIEGEVNIPNGVHLHVFPIRSAGGPTSTRPHYILGFGGTRVKVAKGNEGSRFELRSFEDGYEVLDTVNGRTFLSDVDLVPAVMHAPEQAFINIAPNCNQGCLFCSGDSERPLDWPPERWVDLVMKRYEKEPFPSMAITTGMPGGLERMLEHLVQVVEGTRRALPDIPIGVEPNAVDEEGLQRLKRAGAHELKVNIQTATQGIFQKVCPNLDRGRIFQCLKDGVNVFGRGLVASNLIIGLGEKDEDVIGSIEELATMGVAVNLRAVRTNDLNRDRLEEALGTKVGLRDPQRLVSLVEAQRSLFQEHGLDPKVFRTMCHRCGCCDITVGLDL